MKYVLLIAALWANVVFAQDMTPEEVVQENLDHYNAGDIDSFMKSFSEDISVWKLGEKKTKIKGLTTVRDAYKGLFQSSPNLHSKILSRIVIGNKVIDHEYITGRHGSNEPLILVMIYEVNDQKITKMTVIRE